jgi:hypothetical protein
MSKTVKIDTTTATTRQVSEAIGIGLQEADDGDVLGALDKAKEAIIAGRVPDFVERDDNRREIDDSEPLAEIANLEALGWSPADALKQVAEARAASYATEQRWREKRRKARAG